MKNNVVLRILLALASGLWLLTAISAEDAEIKLSGTLSTNKFVVQDSVPATRFAVGADGTVQLYNNGNLNINGSGKLHFDQGGTNVTYINEGYGLQLFGDATHPIQIRSCALLVNIDATGSSYTAGDLLISGKFYPGNQTTRYISANSSQMLLEGDTYVEAGADEALIIRDGGDLKIYNAANTGFAIVACDADGVITITNDIKIVGDDIQDSGGVEKIKFNSDTPNAAGIAIDSDGNIRSNDFVKASNIISVFLMCKPTLTGPADDGQWTNSGSNVYVTNSPVGVNGSWIDPAGKYQVKMVFRGSQDSGTTGKYMLYHAGSYVSNWEATSEGWTLHETGWTNITSTTLDDYHVEIQRTGGGGWFGINSAWLLVKPQNP